ncbi:MAG: histidine kinase [bacterium]|nr:histidine kinase [bacterium]MDY4099689.1 histidine kinase [Lachnospiraceae bacterium]
MKGFLQWIESKMDNFTIKRKLIILYIFCVIMPLIITDSVVGGITYQWEKERQKHEMENIASAVQYNLSNEIDSASRYAKSIYTNKYIDDFLKHEYDTPLDYYTKYQSFFKDALLQAGIGQNNMQLTLYADNDTIISGSEFQKVSEVRGEAWYTYLLDSQMKRTLYVGFEESGNSGSRSSRKIFFLQRLNFYGETDNVLRLEIDYSSLVRRLEKMNYDTDIFICQGDKIILSNGKQGSVAKDFETFTDYDGIGYAEHMSVYGQELELYVMKPKTGIVQAMVRHFPFILLLLFVNVLLPFLMVSCINHSFTARIGELSAVFDRVDDDKLVEIWNVRGTDEIGGLMRNYNRMVRRMNDLIQNMYKNKIKEQEMIVARQNAELLALHSQINPHFLFNALESIRMHSIIKHEMETADMVERLAVLQRQYVEWQDDSVQVDKEMDFVETYLELQKYRFGDKLSFELDVEEACKGYVIPKLSIVTFVENACVHGIESKATAGWIFVRIYERKDQLCLEIEDTGNGMEEEETESLKQRMADANIEMLKGRGRVGIVNACLRLKMVSKDEVSFDVDSEQGVGTLILVKIPLHYVTKEENNAESIIGR